MVAVVGVDPENVVVLCYRDTRIIGGVNFKIDVGRGVNIIQCYCGRRLSDIQLIKLEIEMVV